MDIPIHQETLFIMSDSDIDAVFLQQLRCFADICLTEVIGEQHFRLDDLRGTNQLFHRHRIGLVAG